MIDDGQTFSLVLPQSYGCSDDAQKGFPFSALPPIWIYWAMKPVPKLLKLSKWNDQLLKKIVEGLCYLFKATFCCVGNFRP